MQAFNDKILFDVEEKKPTRSTERVKIGVSLLDPPSAIKQAQVPKFHREPGEYDLEPVAVVKSYRNMDFLNSSHARHLRILAEYEETMQRLRACGVRATIQFFGSARAKDRNQYDKAMSNLVAKLEMCKPGTDDHVDIEDRIQKLKQTEWMCEYMASVQELARRITEWSMSRSSRQATSGVDRAKSALRASFERNLNELCADEDTGPSPLDVDGLVKKLSVAGELNDAQMKLLQALPSVPKPDHVVSDHQRPTSPVLSLSKSPVPHRRYKYLPHSTDDNHPDAMASKEADLFVCTGGGPGFMEAANRGASLVPGGRSIGMGISLPFETGLNPYVTPDLAFEYHYFFTRKFGMAYYMQALVAAPGGFGTMDELFELMTLKQTGKMNREMPIVLFGKEYWQTIVNWQAIAKWGTISQKEVDDLCFTDSVEEAFEFITSKLTAQQCAIGV